MYIFSRRRRINPGHARAAVANAVEISAKVGNITGLNVGVWGMVASPDAGVITWSTRLDDLEQLSMAFEKLMAASDFQDWIEATASDWDGGVTDGLVEVVHGSPAASMPAYVVVTQANLANGHFGDGMAIGAQIADEAARITGTNVMFTKTVTGSYAGIGWIGAADSMSQLQANNAALMADAGWLGLIEQAGAVFTPGATSFIMRRIN